MDVSGDDIGGNLSPVQLSDCHSGPVDQHWSWNGSALTTLGKCMDIEGNGYSNGDKTMLWDCTGGGNPEWVPQSNGSMLHPRSGRCLDSPWQATANGTQLQIWDGNRLLGADVP